MVCFTMISSSYHRYEDVHDGCGCGIKNKEGERILQFRDTELLSAQHQHHVYEEIEANFKFM